MAYGTIHFLNFSSLRFQPTMRSLVVLSLVQGLVLLSESASTDTYGSCHESKPMDSDVGNKVFWDAMQRLINRGRIEDITFLALLHDNDIIQRAKPDYDQATEEALRRKIAFLPNGELVDEKTMLGHFSTIQKDDEIYLVVPGWLDNIQSGHKINGICK